MKQIGLSEQHSRIEADGCQLNIRHQWCVDQRHSTTWVSQAKDKCFIPYHWGVVLANKNNLQAKIGNKNVENYLGQKRIKRKVQKFLINENNFGYLLDNKN